MSWQLASFLILGAVLLGGFAWYERSRPPSQVVALVAALAAMAIAGRIAFAAFPNVKPTTDIVVFAGYALGPAPGFAVGALAALSSNLIFGQGPWTPWQMAAWGIVGVLGAGWAVLTRRHLYRIPTAALLVGCAFFYGALTNLSTLTVAGGTPTWGQVIALESSGLPFDTAHAVGNVAFFLAFGPALVRVLLRYRARLEVRWTAAAPAAPATPEPTPSS